VRLLLRKRATALYLLIVANLLATIFTPVEFFSHKIAKDVAFCSSQSQRGAGTSCQFEDFTHINVKQLAWIIRLGKSATG
jgi:hypothetical protein